MKIIFKNKISLRGSSSIKDETGKDVLTVKGKLFSITHKKRICSPEGEVLYVVRNKFFNWMFHSAYICDAEGEIIATLRSRPARKERFLVEGYQDNIALVWNGEFNSLDILKNNEKIGSLHRSFFALLDTYELEAEEENIPFLVAIIVGLDNISDRNARTR